MLNFIFFFFNFINLNTFVVGLINPSIWEEMVRSKHENLKL